MLNESTRPNTSLPTNWVRSDELVKNPSGLIILHNNELYRLRVTRNGKLILTK